MTWTHPMALIPSRNSLLGRSCSRSWVSFERTSGCVDMCTLGEVGCGVTDMMRAGRGGVEVRMA